MRAVVQLVKNASVSINSQEYSKIQAGFLVLLGITHDDSKDDFDYIIDKIIHLRVFRDGEDKMNHHIEHVNGEILVVSQFTLYGDARKGRRPSYTEAAGGEKALNLYNEFMSLLRSRYLSGKVCEGKFGAMMEVNLVNNGPVTILLDSRKKF